jgi:transposase
MTKATRARYTLEFKQEAVRLVESGQSIAAASRTLGLVEQTLFNWVKAHREGTLKGGRQPVEGNPPSRWRSAACEPSWRG